jgi:hypothetical protein
MRINTQSYVSDELTHFVGRAKTNDAERYALLLKILGGPQGRAAGPEGWLQASYREEFGPGFTMLSDGQKRLSTNEAIKWTMLCFCDIPPGQLKIHMQKYKSFGIAFPKQFLLRQGATPVHYVPRNARNRAIGIGPQNVADRFDELRAELQRVRVDLEEYVTRIDGAPTFLWKRSRQVRQTAIDFSDVSRRWNLSLKSSCSPGSSFSRKDFQKITPRITTWNANGGCTMG